VEPTSHAGSTLVTGATGFVGSRVLARWLDRGRSVRALVRDPGGLPGVDTVVGDLRDHPSLARAVTGVDVVVHCAVDESDDLEQERAVNVGGTRALAEAALEAGCRRFVHISSCGAYALEGVEVVTEDTPLWPEDRADSLVYGATKAMAERSLQEVAARGLGVVILRPPNILGAHPRSVFCAELATRLRDGTVGYSGDGGNTWPYVHVDNLVDAVEHAVDREVPPGRAYTIVDGHTTWRAFLEDHAAWFGVPVPPRARRDLYDDFRGRFRTDRARDELGYQPRRSYSDALTETRRWLVQQGLLSDQEPDENVEDGQVPTHP
jgi:nucleoside-diphosphate-sugar epimerase